MKKFDNKFLKKLEKYDRFCDIGDNDGRTYFEIDAFDIN